MHGYTTIHTHRHTDKATDRKPDIHRDRQLYIQTDKYEDGHLNRICNATGRGLLNRKQRYRSGSLDKGVIGWVREYSEYLQRLESRAGRVRVREPKQ